MKLYDFAIIGLWATLIGWSIYVAYQYINTGTFHLEWLAPFLLAYILRKVV